MIRRFLAAAALCALGPQMVQAASLAISIGIRETGNVQPIFANGGSTGGIEFVNLDGQSLTADGTWQLFSFTPASDALTAFAGATANSVLEPGLTHATLEMIRVRNINGITQPIRLWVDNVTNTVASGPVTEGFEGFAVGTEVMFQEPRFSGSTANQLALTPNTAAVTSFTAFAGSQSYQADYAYLDNDPAKWLRFTTFGTANVLNPTVVVREPGAPNPTISFYAKAVVVPEPGAAALAFAAAMGLAVVRRRD